MYDICCVGHITLDKIVTTQNVVHMAGGTSFYFSNAICSMDVRYTLVTALAVSEMKAVTDLQDKGIAVQVLPSAQSVYFENNYAENQDHRTQRVLQKADPFTVAQLANVEARIFHLGPLLADDMTVELIQTLSRRGKVSLDVQGFLREVCGVDVCPVDWADKREGLQYVHTLKANESEMEVLTGFSDVHEAARTLHAWGVKEVVITLGSLGSVIYTDGVFYDIPAYVPASVTDATGCGDTYMAGYLFQRSKGASAQDAGEFAAAMASVKIASSGPFTGNEADVRHFLAASKAKMLLAD